MISRVWGTCDGREVAFVQNEQGLWQAMVPAVRYGVYYIEVWAEDGAGNAAYCAAIRLSFDPATMCMKVEITDIGEEFSMRDIRSLFVGETVGAKIEKCEVCGR